MCCTFLCFLFSQKSYYGWEYFKMLLGFEDWSLIFAVGSSCVSATCVGRSFYLWLLQVHFSCSTANKANFSFPSMPHDCVPAKDPNSQQEDLQHQKLFFYHPPESYLHYNEAKLGMVLPHFSNSMINMFYAPEVFGGRTASLISALLQNCRPRE